MSNLFSRLTGHGSSDTPSTPRQTPSEPIADPPSYTDALNAVQTATEYFQGHQLPFATVEQARAAILKAVDGKSPEIVGAEIKALTDLILGLITDFDETRLSFRWIDSNVDIPKEKSLFTAFEGLRKTYGELVDITKKDALSLKVSGPGEFTLLVKEVVNNASKSDGDVIEKLAGFVQRTPNGPWTEYDILKKLTSDIDAFETLFRTQTAGEKTSIPPALESALKNAEALQSQQKRINEKIEELRKIFSSRTSIAIPEPILVVAPGYTTTILVLGSVTAVNALNDIQDAVKEVRRLEHDIKAADDEIVNLINKEPDSKKGSIPAAQASLARIKIRVNSVGTRLVSLPKIAKFVKDEAQHHVDFLVALSNEASLDQATDHPTNEEKRAVERERMSVSAALLSSVGPALGDLAARTK